MSKQIIPLTYRNWLHGQPPKRTKLEIPGWAGENTWETPQPWHCKPFCDSSCYGLDLLYTWQTTCTVSCDENGMCTFDGEFEQEKPKHMSKDWYPFACFAPYHFGFVSMVDIKTPPDHNLMVLPHPRFYSDKDGSIPCAISGQLEMDWWPEIFFIVFKAPIGNNKLVFKYGDPIAQFIVVPRNIEYNIKPMDDEDATYRAQQQSNLEKNWTHLCTRVFYCKDVPGCEKDNFFDNKYKVLSQIAKRDGQEVVSGIIDEPHTIPHWNDNPQVVDNRDGERIPKHEPWPETKEEPKAEPEDSLTNEDFEEMYGTDLLEKVDAMLEKEEDTTEEELDQLIMAFKMNKRKQRMERSNKLKQQSSTVVSKPNIIMANKPDVKREIKPEKAEFMLGYKMEKLI